MAPRVYRHPPYFNVTYVLAAVVFFLLLPVLGLADGDPDVDVIAVAGLALVVLSAAAVALMLIRRVRTVVDDEAVTQYWVFYHNRIPYTEITAVVPDFAFFRFRWLLRIHCGDLTYEVIPCDSLLGRILALNAGPPRVLVAARADIEKRWAAATANPSQQRLPKPGDAMP